MTESKRQMMMTDIVDILVSYDSNIDDLLICAEKMYISAAGQLANQLSSSEEGWKRKMQKFAKLVSERLQEKLLARIETADKGMAGSSPVSWPKDSSVSSRTG